MKPPKLKEGASTDALILSSNIENGGTHIGIIVTGRQFLGIQNIQKWLNELFFSWCHASLPAAAALILKHTIVC